MSHYHMLNTVRHVAMTKHTLLICSKSCKGVRGWVHPKWHSIGPSTMLNMRCQAFGEESNSERYCNDSRGGHADWQHRDQPVSAGACEEEGNGPTSTWENLNQWFWGADSTISSSSRPWELLERQRPGLGIWFSW